MTKIKKNTLIALGALFSGLVLLAVIFYRPVTLLINGTPYKVRTYAPTVGMALALAGVHPSEGDSVQPGEFSLLGWNQTIRYDQLVPVTILSGSGAEQEIKTIYSTYRTPQQFFNEAGMELKPQDEVLWNGLAVPHTFALPFNKGYFFQHRPAVEVTLIENGQSRSFLSARATLIEALWGEGVILNSSDSLSAAADTPLTQSITVVLRRAMPFSVQMKQSVLAGRSAAGTVGQALAEMGVSLQGLDYSEPGSDHPLEKDAAIKVVRVREEVLLEQSLAPFDNEYVADAELGLDERKVLAAGQAGLKVSSVRVRYEDGEEMARAKESEWVASDPIPQKIAYGTKASINTASTPDGTIEYYRAVNVYATSYSPCRSGITGCSKSTASGMAAQKGVIAVTSKWYRLLAGQRVYVPGYGFAVIGDVGGGVPGKYWIDLAYSDDDYQSWHQEVTLYFLTPVPENVPWMLP